MKTLLILLCAIFSFESFAATKKCSSADKKINKVATLGADDIPLRESPGLKSKTVINKKATERLKEVVLAKVYHGSNYMEVCRSGKWSYIKMTEPDYLIESHQGWILTKNIVGASKESLKEVKINPNVFDPYTRSQFPDTYKKLRKRWKDIQKFRIKAAEHAIASKRCKYVKRADISDKSTRKSLKFFMDCGGGQRFLLTEKDIAKKIKLVSEQEKSWSEKAATAACKSMIIERTLIPSTLDIHSIFGVSFKKFPITHKAVLYLNFDAKNGFGVEHKYKAICNFKPGIVGDIEIVKRK